MTFRYNKLRGRIVEVHGSQKKFADTIGISESTVASKLSGRLKFSQDEVLIWANALNIPKEDIGLYFFDTEPSNDEGKE